MKVFISWSGKTSGELAKILREWLPSVIQAVKPYYSTDDIGKGTRRNTVNSQELEESEVGLLCITKDNLEAPWIMFEAGSLAKKLDISRVCPILFGNLETTDLQGPLVHFQAAKFNEEDMLRVIKTVNKQLGDTALDSSVLDNVFTKWWPDLEQKVREVLTSAAETEPKTVRSERELIEEVLTLTRSMAPFVKDIAEREKTKSLSSSPPIGRRLA